MATLNLLSLLLLLLMNAFFVLAEFSMVKARPTQVEALASQGDRRARRVARIQADLDTYLSVCQVGITFTSIGLGFFGEPAVARLLESRMAGAGFHGIGAAVGAHAIALAIAYALVSYLHVVLGELVPKSVANRKTVEIALFTALPMTVFRILFLPAIWILRGSVRLIVKAFRISAPDGPAVHSEDEIRIILDRSQAGGQLSFRQLLHIENILDMGSLTVRNAMRSRGHVKCLNLHAGPGENGRVIAENRFSRYPLLGTDPQKPLGYVHVKDLFLAAAAGLPTGDLAAFARPCMTAWEDDALEPVLSEMQRKACHMTLVHARDGGWSGILTLEDALEEAVGTIEEEYPQETAVRLADTLSPATVFLDVDGEDILSVTGNALRMVHRGDLPISPETIILSVAERERMASTYLGRGLAVPHARLSGLKRANVLVIRPRIPIPAPVAGETIRILFLLMTPDSTPRIHQILLSHIAGIFESESMDSRIEAASSPMELCQVIGTAEQMLLG